MLNRAALVRRIYRQRNISSLESISPGYAQTRCRSTKDRPTEPPVLQQSYLDRADPEKGPVRNRMWEPAYSLVKTPDKRRRNTTENPQRPQPPEAPRIQANGQKSSFSTSSLNQSDKSKEPTSSSSSSKRPEASRSSEETQPEPEASQPLPDLRQGIPSTFDQEISSRSPFRKEEHVEQTRLDLAESATSDEQDQARPRGGGRREEYKSSIERKREMMAFYGFLTGGTIALATLLTLGQNWDEREARGHPDIPNGWTPGAVYARARTRLSEMLGYYTEPAFPQLLPTVDPAYRQPYTLVLSLEDLLVSSKWTRQNGWEVAKRPGLDYFIRYLSQYYELVLFTSVPSMNGQPVYAKLDPFHFIMFPLFREATRYMNGQHVKVIEHRVEF